MSTDNTEPDWSKVELSDQYDWVDSVSTNGKPFKIGTSKSDSPPRAADEVGDLQLNATEGVQAQGKNPFDIKVNWPGQPPPSGFIDFNKPTAEQTQTTSITSWFLETGPLKYNEFEFTCTEAYNFLFYDATGDSYRCNVFWPRDGTVHTVTYFSSDPTIVRITGS